MEEGSIRNRFSGLACLVSAAVVNGLNWRNEDAVGLGTRRARCLPVNLV